LKRNLLSNPNPLITGIPPLLKAGTPLPTITGALLQIITIIAGTLLPQITVGVQIRITGMLLQITITLIIILIIRRIL